MVAGSGRPTMYIVAYESKALNAPTLKARLKSEAGALLRGPPLLALSSLGPPRKNEDILCAALLRSKCRQWTAGRFTEFE